MIEAFAVHNRNAGREADLHARPRRVDERPVPASTPSETRTPTGMRKGAWVPLKREDVKR